MTKTAIRAALTPTPTDLSGCVVVKRTALDEATAERDRLRAENVAIANVTAERDALKALVVQMREALDHVRAIISDGAMDGFNYKYGDWAERLFKSQHVTREALSLTPADLAGCVVVPSEPTSEMGIAGMNADDRRTGFETCCHIYRAMLNAALTTGGDDADHQG